MCGFRDALEEVLADETAFRDQQTVRVRISEPPPSERPFSRFHISFLSHVLSGGVFEAVYASLRRVRDSNVF